MFYTHPLDREVLDDLSSFIGAGAKTLIDIGCYNGDYIPHFQKAGAEVVGFDIRPRELECRFILGDARQISAYGKYDMAFCSNLIYHLEDPLDFLQQLRSVAKIVWLRTCLINESAFLKRGENGGCEGWWTPQGEDADYMGSGYRPTFLYTENGLNEAMEKSNFTFVKEYSRLITGEKQWPLQLYI